MPGIREYHRGVVLKRHVDRVQSHVLSAILNIAQQGMDSQWCLTIQDHQGEEHEAVLTPGEMLLYESAALVHGGLLLQFGHYCTLFLTATAYNVSDLSCDPLHGSIRSYHSTKICLTALYWICCSPGLCPGSCPVLYRALLVYRSTVPA